MSRHANEIGGAQMAPELACDELSRTGEDAKHAISIIAPCLNPDGQIIVTDWYRK